MHPQIQKITTHVHGGFICLEAFALECMLDFSIVVLLESIEKPNVRLPLLCRGMKSAYVSQVPKGGALKILVMKAITRRATVTRELFPHALICLKKESIFM